MGRPFLRHVGGKKVYCCYKCRVPLARKDAILSKRFTGATGRAYLFERVSNVVQSDIQDRMMITGRHLVRDVSCMKCGARLGWIYEFALQEEQKYKEGRVILEQALIVEREFDVADDDGGSQLVRSSSFVVNQPVQQVVPR